VKLGIVVSSNDPETVWNAFRFGNFTLAMGDEVGVFLIGKGVEVESLDTDTFDVARQMQTLFNNGGHLFACGTCLELCQLKISYMCKVSTLQDLYELVKESDRVVSF